MSNLRDKLAIAQEIPQQLKLSEVQKLKATIHKMELIDLKKSTELVQLQIRHRSLELHNKSIQLEREFQIELMTTKKFDWESLTFVEDNNG